MYITYRGLLRKKTSPNHQQPRTGGIQLYLRDNVSNT